MEIRPSSVRREQIVLRVKWDSGEVCCHQQVGTKSARQRSRRSIRYCGGPLGTDAAQVGGDSLPVHRTPRHVHAVVANQVKKYIWNQK